MVRIPRSSANQDVELKGFFTSGNAMRFCTWRTVRRWLGAFVAASCCLVAAASARGETLSERLIADAKDGELNQFDYVAAAFIAGGVTDEQELKRCLADYAAKRSQVLESCRATSSAGERLAELHRAMHQRMLRGQYQSAASDLRVVLETGNFNCLSAVVIYWDLCQTSELALEIWLAPGHVDLHSPGVADSIAPAAKAWQSQAPGDASPARQITPVELLGKFYYNRGVELLERKQFAAGLGLVEKALQLDAADVDARENLLAGINNWAVDRLRAKRPQEAAALIRRGLSLAPAFAPLIANEQLLQEAAAVP